MEDSLNVLWKKKLIARNRPDLNVGKSGEAGCLKVEG